MLRHQLLLLVLVLMIPKSIPARYTQGELKRYTQDTWRHRLKRSTSSSAVEELDGDHSVFDDDDDIGGEIVVQDKEALKQEKKSNKRSHIEDSISGFDDKSKGALIVIDAEGKNPDEVGVTKSEISSLNKKKITEDKGYTVVLDNNGNIDKDEKKDEIYNNMEGTFDQMDKRFNNFVKNAKSHKRVRVIVITPKTDDDSIGDERDRLPDPDSASLDNLAEVNKDLLVGEMNKGTKEEEQLLTDSARKSELEIDIDKLKHVKEKLKLLNEDDEKNNSSIDGYLSEENRREAKIKALRLNLESSTLDKTAIQEAEHELDTLISYSSGKNERFDDSLQQDKNSSVEIHNSTVTHDEGSSVDNDIMKMRDHLKNMTVDKTKGENSSSDVNINKEKEKNTERENSNNETLYSHEVKYLPHEGVDSQSNGNASETNHIEIHEELKTDDTNDRKHAISKSIDSNLDKPKKEKNGEKYVIKFNDDQQPKLMLPPGNPVPGVHEPPGNPYPGDHDHSEFLLHGEKPTSHIHKGTEAGKVIKRKKEPTEAANRGTVAVPEKHKKENVGPSQPPNNISPPTPKVFDKRKAQAIIEFLNKDPLESWRYHFNTLKSLDLNSSILRSGLVNAGNIERLKGVMRRALEGKDITLSIIGGSISAGGGLYKDRGNIDGLYYKGVVDWWNKMITPLTGSDMVLNNIAIGSIGTDYFSYCVKSHIASDTDIVLWELAANDYNRYKMQPTKGARPLERLTRMVLELPNKPALLYVNFFKGVDYKAARESCPNFEDQGEDIIAHYYKIPSLSWRAMVCGGLVRQEPGYNIDNLFSQDQYHPSLRGHAQMSLLLLLHLRHVMRAVLQWAISHNGLLERFEDQYILPEPLFMGPKYPEPLCWTLITADMNERITNTLSVKIVKDDGFKLEYATNFPIRYDKVICWKAERAYGELELEFHIPENYGPTGIKRHRSEVAITTHTRWGGASTMWIDDMRAKSIVIKEGRPNDPGKRTQVDSIANDITPGTHTLYVRAHEEGFCLAAIMIDGS